MNTSLRRRLDAAATPKLCSTSFGFNKNRAAVKINKHKKTKISTFPRSNPDHFYGFKISKYKSDCKKGFHYLVCLVLVIF